MGRDVWQIDGMDARGRWREAEREAVAGGEGDAMGAVRKRE
jgi:hypothetical protein